MRRLFLFAVTALAAIACNKSELDVVNPNNSFVGTPMTITVEMPSSTDTKLDLDQTEDTWITKWTNGDKLTAIHYSGTTISDKNTSFTLLEVSEDGKSATFDGSYDDDQDGMVLVYSGTSEGNLLSGQAGLTLANQSIKMSTTNDENVVTPNAAGALSEYSYMISEQIDLLNIPEDYNSVTVKHLTALMELKLQLTNLPDDINFSVSEVQIGVSQTDYDELKEAFDAGEFEGILTEMPKFATLYNEESYDLTKGFNDDGFATASEDMGVYNLKVEGLEVSSTSNTFTIPFNAFPFMVMQGEYFDITVVLTQNNVDDNLSFFTPLNFSICNETGSDLEFARGKHHTISYSYECKADDFEYIWDGSTFESIDAAKSVLGEAVNGIYYIESASMLAAMSYLVNNDNSNYGSASYTLTCPIDLNSKEWTPIGNEDNMFTGTFNGNNCTISNLYINSTSSFQGLFGYVSGATIQDLTVSGSVTGSGSTGGIVGQAYKSAATTISNCHNSASVTGVSDNSSGYYVGGILGASYGNNNNGTCIINCSNTGTIEADAWVGGIVGSFGGNSIVNCYNLGEVTATSSYGNVGGIAGYLSPYSFSNMSYIINCYNTGALSGSSSVGGIAGYINDYSSVSDCYWLKGVAEYGFYTALYFGAEKTGSNDGAESKTDAEMQHQDFTTLLRNGAYIYNETELSVKAYSWGTSPPLPYPVFNSYEEPTYNFQGQGLESMPYLITSANDLRQLSEKVNAGESYSGKYFEMTKDIDLGGESNEFTAIGYRDTNAEPIENREFQGIFNGADYTVKGLYINKPNVTYQGLFGFIQDATIKNLTVEGNVIGGNNTGGIVGYAYGSNITNCYNKATVAGVDNYSNSCFGGIVGSATSNSCITNCYNGATISGYSSIGGIAGYSKESTLANSYNTAEISGNTNVGGIVGTSYNNLALTNCYNIAGVTASSGNSTPGGVIGNFTPSTDQSTTLTNCYWNSDIEASRGIGNYSNSSETIAGEVTKMTSYEMQAASFVTLLNNGAYTYNQTSPATNACGWTKLSSYPELDFDLVPTYSQFSDENAGTGL